MKGRALKAISTLKIKNTQVSDCRIVGLSEIKVWYLRIQSLLQVYFSFNV